MEEQIKLEDFLEDVAKAFSLDVNEFKPDIGYTHSCPKCKKHYSATDKFCSKDGAEIVETTYEFLSEDTRRYILDVLYDLTTTDIPEIFPYEYVDSIEKRGDGDGYYMNFIFKRKSDGKFFYYTSYDGRIEENTLSETIRVVKTTWDFEKMFS